MKKICNYVLKCLVLLTLVLLTACEDYVAVEDTNFLTPEEFFETQSQVEGSVNASYNQLQTLYQRFGYVFPDAMSDEVVSSGEPNFAPYNRFEFNPNLAPIAVYYTACFNGVGACNFVILNEDRMRANVPTSNFTNEYVDNALGQAYFLRGLYYYYLVKRFGGVPLKSDASNIIEDQPRATSDQIYNQIISDLQEATRLTLEKGSAEVGRVTKEAAFAMLGKVYLHRKMYEEAQDAFDEVRNHSLLPLAEYRNNFNESGEYNDESMFEVGYNGDVGTESQRWAQTGSGLSELTFRSQDYTGWANAKPSNKLIDEFEDDDPRFDVAILSATGSTYGPGDNLIFPCPGCVGGPVWYKFSQLYDETDVSQNSGVNVRIMRYADVVLMKAEVEMNLDNLEDAVDLLNEIRVRAEMPLYGSATMDARGFPANTKDQIFRAIVHERFVELCGEQVRFDDLVRWDLDGQELPILPDENYNNPDELLRTTRAYNPAVHRLMPIPQNAIDGNSEISASTDQNPGY